ncbi:carboxy-S-adenosyl-L-methionine synthase CmoA [Aestuariibacter halophilus]|uniref:Carboxy-S-adenosyl-L-methionine synthase n=1 Tax=Fluctibacter halophilus TaxID=226011 RepID=A0ABS8G609_9ALTE|nr:carboxy-S-adenosyl-L-methionine synthase CmoA [Aestuariibacter halophilus]MCC2615551.1 carboxy-S-adenosyl-L-methionine synthase CmoA [Aestuariibacter halophilus]
MHQPTDALYAHPHPEVEDFRFDQRVAEVFPDMIQRSIPGYTTIIDGIGQLAARFSQPDSALYDLGCSLGGASLSMGRYVSTDGCRIIGIDNSQPMVERCRLHVEAFKTPTPVTVVCQDILDVDFEPASVIVMNFTLQFVEPEVRQDLLQRLYDALLPGGLLILSEKVNHPHPCTNDAWVDLHHEFKRRNGYSELEISQKRTALENVMRLDSLQTHLDRLTRLGFEQPSVWFQCYNFLSMMAIKGESGDE